jgi:hypothetical protein
MAARIWHFLEDEQPTNEQQCWVRINYWNYPPFVATWYEGFRAFQSDLTDVVFYDYQVSKWSAYP